MKILALELSSRQRSIAWLDDERPPVEISWEQPSARNQPREALFDRVTDLLRESGGAMDQVDLFAVGRGPGAYSGMRAAIAAAQGLALPDSRSVYAVSSGAALAFDVASETDGPVAVIGDARRDTLWVGVFERAAEEIKQTQDWQLASADDIAGLVPEEAVIVSPDWERLKEKIASFPLRTGRWMEGDRYPSATAVGRLAGIRRAKNRPSEPLTPLYLHPAVFVPPNPSPG